MLTWSPSESRKRSKRSMELIFKTTNSCKGNNALPRRRSKRILTWVHCVTYPDICETISRLALLIQKSTYDREKTVIWVRKKVKQTLLEGTVTWQSQDRASTCTRPIWPQGPKSSGSHKSSPPNDHRTIASMELYPSGNRTLACLITKRIAKTGEVMSHQIATPD